MLQRLFGFGKAEGQAAVPRKKKKVPGDEGESVLRTSKDAILGEERAKAAADAAASSVIVRIPPLPEGSGICERAAALFAAGDAKNAQETLIQHLNTSRGVCPEEVWYLLFDIYLVQQFQNEFLKLAEFFAHQFNMSPPAWETFGDDVNPQQSTAAGRNALLVEGSPLDIAPEKMRDVVRAAKEARMCRLNLSRLALPDGIGDREKALQYLLQFMRRLRFYNIHVLLMGENDLVEQLRRAITQSGAESIPHWELLMEFLQWRGQEEAFETLAMQFAERFHQSPPGYELDGVIAVAPQQTQSAPSYDADVLVPEDVLDDSSMTTLLAQLDHALSLHRRVRIQCRQVRRLTFEAATRLAGHLVAQGIESDQVWLIQPTSLLVYLLKIANATSLVTLVPRKR